MVTPVVLAEVTRVLDSVYGCGRERVAASLRALLDTPPFTVTGRASVLQALEWYLGGPADFSDTGSRRAPELRQEPAQAPARRAALSAAYGAPVWRRDHVSDAKRGAPATQPGALPAPARTF